MIGTNNPICLSIAMHLQQSVKVDSYLFSDFLSVNHPKQNGVFRFAEMEDQKMLVDFYHQSMGASREWLNGYLANLVKKKEICLLEENDEILGVCEIRKSESDPTVTDLGMVVSPAHRKKGIGTYLLGKAKDIALQRETSPICSCEKDNIGSLKSIQNNGFRTVHQMLLMEF
jgi:predicted acetyltransferase